VRGRFFRQSRTQIRPGYERKAGRLKNDRALVADLYPSLEFQINESSRLASLRGEIVISSECGLSTRIATFVTFPWDYPGSEPAAHDADKRFQPWPGKSLRDRHITEGGRCCLWLPPCSPWDSADPLALRLFLDQLTIFFDKQLIYDYVGEWLWPAYGHEDDGYVEFIREQLGNDVTLADSLMGAITMRVSIGPNERCPCNSGQKFKKCHLPAVDRIQGRIGVERIRACFPRPIDKEQNAGGTQSPKI
jgi:hypothetical protein